jgi:hypothetical protein
MAGRLGAERDPGPAPAPRVGGPRRFPAALRALEHHDFRRFWLGQVVSLVGRSGS